MRKMKFGILLVIAVLALVSVASATLPFNPVTANVQFRSGPTYATADVTSGVSPELPIDMYDAWCADTQYTITAGVHTFTAYSSLDQASIDASGMPSVNWKKVNYILNHKNADWKITQAAIWHYDGSPNGFPTSGPVSGYSHEAFTAYINTVDELGGQFTPSCGETYAVILYKVGHQIIFVEKSTTDCHEAPEFPTLALPVAMLIGVVGAVQFVRARKE